MLQKIEIENFKKIGSPGIVLDNLAQVNYLVGENGCGKSSVLEALKICFGNLVTSPSNLYNVFGDLTKVFDTNTILKYTELINNDISTYEFKIINVQNELLDTRLYKKTNIMPDYKTNYICNYLSTFTSDIYNNIEYKESINLYDQILRFDLDIINSTNVDDLIEFLNKYYYLDPNLKVRNVFRSLEQNSVIQIELENSEKVRQRLENLKSLASGFKTLLAIYFSIFNLLKSYADQNVNKIICIEELETSFHPKFQKLLPQILKDLASKLGNNTQFFIATHSPFIISSAADFAHTQKVYLIKDGQTANPLTLQIGLAENNFVLGSKGVSGNISVEAAAKMLGGGLEDVVDGGVKGKNIKITKTNKIIYCEGSDNINSFRDDLIYQIIFDNKIKDQEIIFISCGGCDNVEKTYYISKQVTELNENSLEVDYILDGDGVSDEKKRLKRRDLESYLYDKSIIKIYDEKNSTNYFEIVKDWNFENNDIKQKVNLNSQNTLEKKFPNDKKEFVTELAHIIADLKSEDKSTDNIYIGNYIIVFSVNKKNNISK